MNVRALPSDPNLERVLLSTIFLKEDALKESLNTLSENDFHESSHQEIYSAITEAANSGQCPDLPLIYQILTETGMYSKCSAALTEISKTASTVNYHEIILKIRDLSEKRRMATKIEQMYQEVFKPGKSAGDILAELNNLIDSSSTTQYVNMHTVDEIMDMEFPEQKWIVPDIISEGVNLIAAPPKSFKSFLGLDTAVSVSLGGNVLGKKVSQRNTVYLALEDKPRRIQNRLRKQSSLEPMPISSKLCTIATEWEPGASGLLKLHNFVKAKQVGLAVIDTYGRFYPPKDNNDYIEHTGIIASIKKFSDTCGTSVLLIHHTKKLDDNTDFINRAVGSIGITGGVDSILVLSRKRNQYDGVLSITGRDIEEKELGVRFDPTCCRWSILGDAKEIADTKERQEIIDILKDAQGSMSPKDIAGALKKNVGSVKFLLSKMVSNGQITRLHRGEYMPLTPNLTVSTNLTNLTNLANHTIREETSSGLFE